MINVTAQELEGILATFEKAAAMHDQWRERLQRTLICKLPPDEANLAVDAHQLCAFGRWFYSPSNAHLRKLETFKKVGAMHETMHDMARELCTRIKGHWAITPTEYDPFIAQLLAFRNELAKLRHKVEETLLTIDALTGALSGRLLLPDLRQEQETQKSTGQPYSLLLLRFDLEKVNRAHGQEQGDAILRSGLLAIRQALRAEDRVYRYTGAEFVICLQGQTPEAAQSVGQSLLEKVAESLGRDIGEVAAALPVHYGIVALEPDTYIEQLINQAAMATYTIQL